MTSYEFWFKYPHWSDEEILRRLRKSREVRFNIWHYDMWTRNALTFSLPHDFYETRKQPIINLDHLQDFCNKPVALYWADAKTSFVPAVYRHIMQHWATDGNLHKTDIEFGRFFAKFIRITGQFNRITSSIISKVRETHFSLCREFDTREDELRRDRSRTVEDKVLRNGMNCVNRPQTRYYDMKPLFRAVVMIICEQVSSIDEQMVHLVRTGIVEDLSAPIIFPCENGEIAKSITISLTDAIFFITALDQREETVFPSDRDKKVLDNFLDRVDQKAKRFGWKRGNIPGPSTKWCKDKSRDVTKCVHIPESWDGFRVLPMRRGEWPTQCPPGLEEASRVHVEIDLRDKAVVKKEGAGLLPVRLPLQVCGAYTW